MASLGKTLAYSKLLVATSAQRFDLHASVTGVLIQGREQIQNHFAQDFRVRGSPILHDRSVDLMAAKVCCLGIEKLQSLTISLYTNE